MPLNVLEKEKVFIETMHNLAVSILKFEHEIAIGDDYDEDEAKRLYLVFDFLRK